MIATSIHIVSAVLPKLPIRQWVLSVPKWIRYCLARDVGLASQVLRIFIDEIQKQLKITLSKKVPDNARLGAVSFIQRFGSNLNLHIHYHSAVMDGIFYEDAEGLLHFLEAGDLSVDDTDAVQTRVRKRVLSLYKRKGLLSKEDAENLRATSIHKILTHIGEETEHPKMHPARGPPNEYGHEDIPEYQYDQTISW